MNVEKYDSILDNLKNYTIANQDKITDFNDGSMILTIFEAIARVIERIYIDTRVGYTDNVKSVPYSMFNFSKKAGVKAHASVVFSRATAETYQTVIPLGTKVSSSGLTFITTAATTIAANATSSSAVNVQAEKSGVEYNVLAGTITSIDSVLSDDVVSVTNAVAASGGFDEETDVEMQERFKLFYNGLQGTSLYGLKAALLGIEGIRAVQIVEHFPPVNQKNFTLYIDDGSGTVSSTLQQKIKTVVDGDGTNLNPGKKAVGVAYDINAVSYVSVDLTLSVKIKEVEQSYATLKIQDAIKGYLDTLSIGDTVYLSEIIVNIKTLTYVTDVSITASSGTTIGVGQIARIGVITVNYQQ